MSIETCQTDQSIHKRIAVFTVGRFNPPTRGHEKLFRKTHNLAIEYGGDAFVFPTSTHGKSKNKSNPLQVDEKIAFMKELMCWVNICETRNVNNAWNALDYLVDQNYTDLYLVAGSDRVEEYSMRWLSYALQKVERAQVISAGMRDPDSEGIASMSGTKAQEAALSGDITLFQLATGWDGNVSERLMQSVIRGLKGQQHGNT